MLSDLQGFILLILGLAIFIFGVLMMFPQMLAKDRAKMTKEKICSLRRMGFSALPLGLLILGASYLFLI